MEKEKTAIIQFVETLHEYAWVNKNDPHFALIFNQFLEKEKQQIVNSFISGMLNTPDDEEFIRPEFESPIDYYNKTYGNEN